MKVIISNTTPVISTSVIDNAPTINREYLPVGGPAGKSAYEIAVSAGFNGTLEDWLLSLAGKPGSIGPKGDKGEAGAAGPQGIKGDTGARGDTGPQGNQGAAGPQGVAGPKGDKGDTGSTGAQGERGVAGPSGSSGKGWTGANYDPQTGKISFASIDGLDFETGDLRLQGSDWNSIINKPISFAPAAHTHPTSEIESLEDFMTSVGYAFQTTNQALLLAVTKVGVANMFTGGTHTNLNATYNTSNETISLSLLGERYTTADRDKLALIAPNATQNATDAQLRDRSTHTGTQSISSISGLQSALDGKSATGHNHPLTEITGLGSLATKNMIATGDIGSRVVTNTKLADTPAFSLKGNATSTAGVINDLTASQVKSFLSYSWNEITGKPANFAPAAHTHSISTIDGLQTALDGKQPITNFKTINGNAITGAGDITIVGEPGPAGTSVNIRTSTPENAETDSLAYPNDLIVVLQ